MKRQALLRVILAITAVFLLFSSVSPNAFAQEPVDEQIINQTNDSLSEEQEFLETAEDIVALEDLFEDPEALYQQTIVGIPKESNDGQFHTMVAATSTVKKGIKWMLKNDKTIIKRVKKISPRAGKSLEIRWNKYVKPTLNKLLTYESVAWEAVEDHIASALHGTGIKNSSARSIAYWVVYVAEWVV